MDFVKRITVDSETEYIRWHIAIVSAVAGVRLTNRELDVLSILVKHGVVDSEGRKMVSEKLKIGKQRVSHIIGSLVKKGMIVKQDNRLVLLGWLFPLSNTELFKIQISYAYDNKTGAEVGQ